MEEAFATLRAAGYTLIPPQLEPPVTKAETTEALGIVPPPPPQMTAMDHAQVYAQGSIKRPDSIYRQRTYTFNLVYAHSINGTKYGPGPTTVTDTTVMQHLLSQDEVAKAQERRTLENVSRCHMIVEVRDHSGNRAAGLRAMPTDFFDGNFAEAAPVFGEFNRRE